MYIKNWRHRVRSLSHGFTSVELLVGIVVFGIMIIGIVGTYDANRQAYTLARQYNEMYAVLSACPEVDRALEFTTLSGATNCYPNNSFQVEDTLNSGNIVYAPSLSVADTSSLPSSDPLRTIPDSKVVSIQVSFPKPFNNGAPLQLRMLITRNGIGQL